MQTPDEELRKATRAAEQLSSQLERAATAAREAGLRFNAALAQLERERQPDRPVYHQPARPGRGNRHQRRRDDAMRRRGQR